MEKLSLEVIHPHCAGIDVGSRFHMVAIGQGKEDVRKFGVFTEDHQHLISWLRSNGIVSVAMESTGSYWQTLFDALQEAGFEAILVNGNHVKNVKGKKTDVQDCTWIQKLHSLGLLSGSFLPQVELQKLRTYYNHRQYLVNQTTRYVNKMQKAMRLMNIRLEVVLNDIMSKSGRAIIEAILQGERDPEKLAGLANYRVKKSKEEIAKSLEGNWRDDLLYELEDCLSLYDQYCARIKSCDHHFESKIVQLNKDSEPITSRPTKRKVASKFSPDFNVERLAHQYFGVNLCEIGGVSHNTVLCMMTHMGHDINKFPTSKHFCSWLRLCPNNKISGGKILSSRTPKGKNRLAIAIRQAANSVGNHKNHPMASFFKRIAFRKGREAAVTATARKLAVTFYHMITKKQDYAPFNYENHSEQMRNRQIQALKRKIFSLNLGQEELQRVIQTSTLPTN